MEQLDGINWPDHYAPANCPIHVRNELGMDVPADRVWAWLIRAPLWPSWYPNSDNVELAGGSTTDLAAGLRFCWKTFGVTIDSTVEEFVPGDRIAWSSKAVGIDVYHAWLIHETAEGCHVLTEETQHGWLARLSNFLTPKRMVRFHQIWLEGLHRQARSGLPPDP